MKRIPSPSKPSFLFFSGFLLFFISSCDQGIVPEPPPAYGIAGTAYFSNWPPPDSIQDLRLVAFKSYPTGNVVNEVLQGNARFTNRLGPHGAAEISYTLLLSPLQPGTFEYIAVAQQYGPNLFADWRAVGVYYAAGDTTRPGTVFVPGNAIVQGVDIYIDFDNPPPPP